MNRLLLAVLLTVMAAGCAHRPRGNETARLGAAVSSAAASTASVRTGVGRIKVLSGTIGKSGEAAREHVARASEIADRVAEKIPPTGEELVRLGQELKSVTAAAETNLTAVLEDNVKLAAQVEQTEQLIALAEGALKIAVGERLRVQDSVDSLNEKAAALTKELNTMTAARNKWLLLCITSGVLILGMTAWIFKKPIAWTLARASGVPAP